MIFDRYDYKPKERRRLILEILSREGSMTVAEMSRASGMIRATTYAHLCELVKRGKIYRTPYPSCVFSIAPIPRQTLAEIYDSLSS
jgi:hypothetical protein